jgi:hypothetical protein
VALARIVPVLVDVNVGELVPPRGVGTNVTVVNVFCGCAPLYTVIVTVSGMKPLL